MQLSSANTQKKIRWLHVHVSMALLLVLLFFAITGITLNRPEFFVAKQPVMTQQIIDMPVTFVTWQSTNYIFDNVGLLDLLRRHGLKGKASAVDVFIEHQGENITMGEVSMNFKAVGYNASVFVDVLAKEIEVSESFYGWIAVLNDLHKGRNTGAIWQLFIDLSALLVVVFSVSGFALLLPKKRALKHALYWTFWGAVCSSLVYFVFVP